MTHPQDTTPANPAQDDSPISQDERVRLFGSEMPVEAVTLMYEAPDDWTAGDLRRELRKIAAERPANPAQGVSGETIDKAIVEAINALRMEHSGRAYDILHEALTAAIGAGGQAVAVKPLEWVFNNTIDSTFKADSVVGRYKIFGGDHNWHWSNSWAGHSLGAYLSNAEAAKAAAQADFEHRILSAIAHPVQPGWRLVPEEPTEAMITAGKDAYRRARELGDPNAHGMALLFYRAMLPAAPQPKGE